LVNKVKKIADREGIKVSTLALAWVLRQGDFVTAIPGTTKIDNLRKNLEAIALAENISQQIIDELSEVTKEGFVGSRYNGVAFHKSK